MRFVNPDTTTIHLKDTETKQIEKDPSGAELEKTVIVKNWIEVKKRLTTGEDRGYRTAGLSRMRPGDPEGKNGDDKASIDVDWKKMAFARALTYITEWSDKRALSQATLEALDPDDFEEIDNAIEAHIKTQEQEKKARRGAPPLPTLSS